MCYHLYREVKRHAPADLDTGELALLLILADEANDETRECFPGMDELCAYMRLSPEGVRRILQRLTKRGIDVRVPIGKDNLGRPVYAQKGARTTYRIPRFAPLADAPMDTREGGTAVPPIAPQRPVAGTAFDEARGDAGTANDGQRRYSSTAKAVPQYRPSPHVPHEEDPHLLPSQRILRQAGLTLGEDDEKRFIDWINRDARKGTPWWRKVAANGDLPGLVDAWRKETGQPQRQHSDLPEWCGQCGDSNPAAKTNTRFRTDTGLPGGTPCPTCHPDAVPSTQQPAAARGYQPYRNPVDHSVYFEPIS